MEDLTGQTVGGRYRIRELVGVGGMDSTVWKAWQSGTERTIAIKVLPPAEDAAAKRFARGARIAANLSHPNCLVIHDYGTGDRGELFLVMEFLVGQVLQDVLGIDGMPIDDVLHIADQVLQALEHAHSHRAVHRDLKPDNLFLTRKNEDTLHVKILDFGIAKYIEEDYTDPNRKPVDADGFSEDLVTEQRQVCGTPQYMAPEQVVGGRVDARTDLYSLGVVMYRMLTGRLPFDGKSRYELYQKHLQEVPAPMCKVRPDLRIPDRLELVIMKALSKQPAQRFQTAGEMRSALASILLEKSTGIDHRQRGDNAPRVAIKSTSRTEGRHQAPRGTSIIPGGGAPSLGDLGDLNADTDHEPGFVVPAGPPPLSVRAPSHVGVQVVRTRPTPRSRSDELAMTHAGWVGEVPAIAPRRASEGTFPDAMIARQPSRIGLQQIPRPSETEPNSSQEIEAPPTAGAPSNRRKWIVAAVLVGAFLIGIGGVAAVMTAFRDDPDTVEKIGSNGVETDRAPSAAKKTIVPAATELAAGIGASPTADPNVGRDAGTPAVGLEAAGKSTDGLAATADDGVGAEADVGIDLPEVPVEEPEATLIEYALDSVPRGATVWFEGRAMGDTPRRLQLVPGDHTVRLELVGHAPQTVKISVTEGTVDSALRRTVYLVRRAEAPVVREPVRQPVARKVQPVERKRPTRAPTARRPAERPPWGRDSGSAGTTKAPAKKPTRKPKVDLLDEDAPTLPTRKRPKVDLLDEDAPSLPKKTPRVDLLDD
ncbi:MAG: serine/threonine protein kinase [Myxococcota bacterium]